MMEKIPQANKYHCVACLACWGCEEIVLWRLLWPIFWAYIMAPHEKRAELVACVVDGGGCGNALLRVRCVLIRRGVKSTHLSGARGEEDWLTGRGLLY